MAVPAFPEPGKTAAGVLFLGRPRVMKNHGEWLHSLGEKQERAKCLFLASAGAVKKNASKVLTQCRQMANRFLETNVLSASPSAMYRT